jgi:hypothetical protein
MSDYGQSTLIENYCEKEEDFQELGRKGKCIWLTPCEGSKSFKPCPTLHASITMFVHWGYAFLKRGNVLRCSSRHASSSYAIVAE